MNRLIHHYQDESTDEIRFSEYKRFFLKYSYLVGEKAVDDVIEKCYSKSGVPLLSQIKPFFDLHNKQSKNILSANDSYDYLPPKYRGIVAMFWTTFVPKIMMWRTEHYNSNIPADIIADVREFIEKFDIINRNCENSKYRGRCPTEDSVVKYVSEILPDFEKRYKELYSEKEEAF